MQLPREPAAPTRQHTVRSAKPRYFVRQSAPREPAAPTRRHTVRSAEPQYFVRQTAPREPAAPTRRHTVQSAEPQYFVRQSAPPQTGGVICLRADEPAARFRKYSALTTKKRDIPSRFLIVLNRCGNYTNSMIAVSEASPRRSPRGMMRV